MKVPIEVNRKPYMWLQESKKRFNYLYGGSSSGKSWTMAQFLIVEKWIKGKNIGILVVRKTRPAVKTSCWVRVTEQIRDLNLKEGIDYTLNKSDLTIRHNNGNFFMFDGLDNVFKKKSIEGINTVWVEEAAGLRHDAIITLREWKHLNIICRAPIGEGIRQMYCTFNPVDPIGNEWLKFRTEGADKSAANSQVMMLNHDDNPFLDAEGHDAVEVLIGEDDEYDKIYRQGLWATPSYIIYTNWDIVNEMPERYDQRVWGLDFGYSSNQTALVEERFVGDKDVYEQEWIYQTNLTNPELIALLKEYVPKNDMIVADSAEPKSIREIRNAGFNIHGCEKGKDSVCFGINTVKAHKCHILASSVNMIRERRGYKWKQDADGNPLPEPLKFLDHTEDGRRYAITKVKGFIRAGVFVPDDEKRLEEDLQDEEMWDEL